MTLRVIDNKRIDLTDSEWELYQQICASYDRQNFKGADLFKDLFETDKNGIIVFLKPPKVRTSMEVFMFLISVMIHQHLGIATGHVEQLCQKLEKKNKESEGLIAQMKQLISKLEKRRARK